MQDRGAVGKCFVDGEHVGELFVDNLDCSNGSSCDLAAGRSDGCNWVAFPQDLFPSQDLLGHEDVVGFGTGFGQVG